MSRPRVNQLNKPREKDRFVRGLVSWVGLPADRRRRTSATSGSPARRKYPYRKMFKFALDGITSFSTAPLKLATWLGYVDLVPRVPLPRVGLVQRALGPTVQGWATIMVALLFLGGVQLICLGIMGEYLGRVFNEIKPRPMYVMRGRIVVRWLMASSSPAAADLSAAGF